ncbi:MAG: hypothetical protein WBB76_13100 [Gaiellaceae bacterium]
MPSTHLADIERALLVISEARERAEQAARSVKKDEGDATIVAALEEADESLLAVHGKLMRAAYFPAGGTERQLRLAG